MWWCGVEITSIPTSHHTETEHEVERRSQCENESHKNFEGNVRKYIHGLWVNVLQSTQREREKK